MLRAVALPRVGRWRARAPRGPRRHRTAAASAPARRSVQTGRAEDVGEVEQRPGRGGDSEPAALCDVFGKEGTDSMDLQALIASPPSPLNRHFDPAPG